MSMKINNSGSLRIISNLRKAEERQQNSLRKLSSGLRVEKAQDDAASLASGKYLEAYVKSQKQAQRNANDGVSFVQTAEGGLNEISNVLGRLRELTVQASSDTVGENERGYLNKEYQELLSEVDRIAQSTSFNGTNVINGEKGVLQFHVGANAGEANIIDFDTDGTFADTDTIGINGTGVETKDEALESIEYIDGAIDQISGQRADLGAVQSRLQHAIGNLEENIINHDAARSRMIDLDVAEESAKLASANLLASAGSGALDNHFRYSQTALKLLKG